MVTRINDYTYKEKREQREKNKEDKNGIEWRNRIIIVSDCVFFWLLLFQHLNIGNNINFTRNHHQFTKDKLHKTKTKKKDQSSNHRTLNHN